MWRLAAPSGFADVTLSDTRRRAFTLHDSDRDVIRVTKRYDSRNSIAQALLWEHPVPMFVALPVLVMLLGGAVGRALRPLDILSLDRASRQPGEASSMKLAGAPEELGPMIKALNGLVNRVQMALDRERHFAADAHQLRTSLAAAPLGLANAATSGTDEVRNLALRRAHESLNSLRYIVNQSLEFARWESAVGKRCARGYRFWVWRRHCAL